MGGEERWVVVRTEAFLTRQFVIGGGDCTQHWKVGAGPDPLHSHQGKGSKRPAAISNQVAKANIPVANVPGA